MTKKKTDRVSMDRIEYDALCGLQEETLPKLQGENTYLKVRVMELETTNGALLRQLQLQHAVKESDRELHTKTVVALAEVVGIIRVTGGWMSPAHQQQLRHAFGVLESAGWVPPPVEEKK
jgi:hypothetical protein